MAENSEDGKKSDATVSELMLDEIEVVVEKNVSDEDDNWGDPADIPDKPGSAQDLDAVSEIPVRVLAVLGRTSMTVGELTKLGRGAVLELDRKVGEALDVYLNNRLVARGEVVVVDDKLGITMTEIIKAQKE
jgi:flagellar motor switch protein FliN/FliY